MVLIKLEVSIYYYKELPGAVNAPGRHLFGFFVRFCRRLLQNVLWPSTTR